MVTDLLNFIHKNMLIRLYKYLIIGIYLILLISCSNNEITINCDVNCLSASELSLFEVVNGELKCLDVKKIDNTKEVQFILQERPGGFYYLATDSLADETLIELFLRDECCNVVLEDEKSSVVSGLDQESQQTLMNWQQQLNDIESLLLGARLTPDIVSETVTKSQQLYEQFVDNTELTDAVFEKWMRLKAEVDYCLVLLSAYSKYGGEVAQKLNEHPVYKKLVEWKFNSANLLRIKDGLGILYLYPDFRIRLLKERLQDAFDYSINLFDNDTLKGLYMIGNIKGLCVTGREYKTLMNHYGHHIVAADQKQEIKEHEKAIEKYEEGRPAIDFCYADSQGNKHALSDFKGQVVLVDVWSTWCGPCKDEMPHLEELINHYGHSGEVAFIGVSINKDKDKWRTFVKEHHLKGVQVIGDKGYQSQLLKDYQIATVPRFMLFDKEGNIVSINCPRPSDPKLKSWIDEQLK